MFNQPWFDRPDTQQMLYDRWSKGFGYIAERELAPVLIGEFGGRQVGTDTNEGLWQRQFMDYLSDKGLSWTYWSWNPNSGDTGGVLQDDWTTINQPKMDLLARLIARQPISFPGAPTAPPATPPATPPVTPPVAPPASGALSAQAVVDASWENGYCVKLNVTNGTTQKATGIRVSFRLPASATVASSWNGDYSRSGDLITVVPAGWARDLDAGKSMEASGFCTSGTTRPTDVAATAAGSVPPVTPPVTPPVAPPVAPPVTPPVTPPSGTGLTGVARLDSNWGTGHCLTMTVSNPTNSPLTPRRIKFQLPTGVSVGDSWNGTLSRSGNQVTAQLPDWSRAIPGGGSAADFGYCAAVPGSAGNLPSAITVE